MQNKLHRRPTNYNADSVGNTNIAKTTAPKHPPRTNAHQGAGNGTNHDPSHGGIT